LSNADAKSSSVKIEILVKPEDLSFRVDPSQIEMVLINLVKNAREALDGQPETLNRAYFSISLRAGKDDKHRTVIIVEDNGPGIPLELLEEIFIPFFTTKPTGTGVGLSISRQIMQLHNGEIRVNSTAGSGAQFMLLF